MTLAELNAALPQLRIVLASDLQGSNPVTLTLNAISSYLTLDVSSSGKIHYCAGVAEAEEAMLGWAAINQQVVQFDWANQRVGFAPLTAGECPLPATNAHHHHHHNQRDRKRE